MKKALLIFGLLVSSLSFAQQEVKLDIADALVIRSLEFSYESYISAENSFGISALFNLAKQDVEFRYNEDTMITPYFRHYFTSEAQWNFFGEGFLGINSGKAEIEVNGNTQLQKYTDGALGVAIGTKYISDSGLVIDVYAGVGRNLFGTDSPILVPRAGVNVGWRF
ncbi:DUF3575 domain-containing protein [Polaribacter haliotis]|uniref:DUF3575 domain-containing protein n=1 Tax=Polaribacter haliotis TaxID=1888915 RepID=A0A7L8AC72_9FLAO|nr:DUF3575 domain-containing protein [Polaribacter haliotis]QOD59524.1 DUF3575 domain-containing protein [Polaribacter haliotis]